jgi:hypothetical protein
MIDLQPAAHGAGPLIQRDYWAVFAGCRLKPSELMAHMRSCFCDLPPAALVSFGAPSGVVQGAELDVLIQPGQRCRVRVLHEDAQSFTLGTLDGHPEAGRITFGSYRNASGDVVIHIRSRARAASAFKLIGFLAIGEAMQTNTWTGFINNAAGSLGLRIDGAIRAETHRVDDVAEDDEEGTPTFLALGN